MPLQVPPLSFQSVEKLGEVMTKAEVTALISAMQSSHKDALDGALKPVREELARVEGLHREAEKGAKKAAALEAELTTTKATYERHTTLSELLGVTDPADIADIAAIHASRTAGQEKPPTLREYIEAQKAAPDTAPATLRGYLERAPQQEQQAAPVQPSAPVQPRTQVQTGGGRVQPAAGTGTLTPELVSQLRRQGVSARDLINRDRVARGLPPNQYPEAEKKV
jgi:hypothetical protein